MRRYYNKGAKGLSGGQVKLDKMGNNDGKISGEDFAVIRSRKMGGGMMKRPMYKKGSRVIPQDFMDTFIADDGYLVDFSKIKRKPAPKYKADGGIINKRSSFMGGGIAYKGGGKTMKRGGKI